MTGSRGSYFFYVASVPARTGDAASNQKAFKTQQLQNRLNAPRSLRSPEGLGTQSGPQTGRRSDPGDLPKWRKLFEINATVAVKVARED